MSQTKLLRVLQEREVERLGGTRPIPVDVRVLAATNQDLRKLVAERRFREDLSYRLNVVTVELPPLRERPEDVDALAQHFLGLHAARARKTIDGFSPEALALLRRSPWPGNVRELAHAVQRAVILSTGRVISPADLALPVPVAAAPSVPFAPNATLAEVEREWIRLTLERCGGNQSAAAAGLGIDRTTLYRRLRQNGGETRSILRQVRTISGHRAQRLFGRLTDARLRRDIMDKLLDHLGMSDPRDVEEEP